MSVRRKVRDGTLRKERGAAIRIVQELVELVGAGADWLIRNRRRGRRR